MIEHADKIIDLKAILYPGSVYEHPHDVVGDQKLSNGGDQLGGCNGLGQHDAVGKAQSSALAPLI